MHDETNTRVKDLSHGFVPYGIVLNSEWIVDVLTVTCTCLCTRVSFISCKTCNKLVTTTRTSVCIFSWTKRAQFFVIRPRRVLSSGCTRRDPRSKHARDITILYTFRWLVRTCTHAHTVPYIHTMVITRSQPFTVEFIVQLDTIFTPPRLLHLSLVHLLSISD